MITASTTKLFKKLVVTTIHIAYCPGVFSTSSDNRATVWSAREHVYSKFHTNAQYIIPL